ncbi:MAG: addiction module protein [Sphingopyxis sp.]|jgi:putative addiction module killer protein|nr:addiction module protein [Sphingopyxis sp.]
MTVQEYIRADGGNLFRDWFEELDPQAAAKVTTGLLRLELGNVSNVKWIGGGLGEYRIDWGPGYRLYLMRDGNELIILFAGGTKRRQKADIKGARLLLDEYRARKTATKR